jgi:hypothetical protein
MDVRIRGYFLMPKEIRDLKIWETLTYRILLHQHQVASSKASSAEIVV